MKYKRDFFAAVLIVFLLLNTVSCSVHIVRTQPEAAVVTRTEAPYRDGTWVESEYRWDGNTYVVVPAHWEKSRGVWVPGHWKQVKGGYTWVPGHWK